MGKVVMIALLRCYCSGNGTREACFLVKWELHFLFNSNKKYKTKHQTKTLGPTYQRIKQKGEGEGVEWEQNKYLNFCFWTFVLCLSLKLLFVSSFFLLSLFQLELLLLLFNFGFDFQSILSAVFVVVLIWRWWFLNFVQLSKSVCPKQLRGTEPRTFWSKSVLVVQSLFN